MTNLDLFQLFSPYGNLISVRIMVEKASGRSRGFGFVSYDNPQSAALAIDELNGYAIGNKRLKVQHKQIRPKHFESERKISAWHSSLPPSGPSAPSSWSTGYSGKEMTSSIPSSPGVKGGKAEPTHFTGGETTSIGLLKEESSPLASLGTLQDALSEKTKEDDT